MRRERAYTLALRAADGEKALQSLPPIAGTLLSQGIFRAAPGGQRLAWLEARSDGADASTLHLTDGKAETTLADVRLFRFSPDGKQLAAVVKTAPESSDLVMLDVTSSARRTVGGFGRPWQIEWSGADVIVRTWGRNTTPGDVFERVAPDGTRVRLNPERCVDELAVAARAPRAIYLTSCGPDGVATAPHLLVANLTTGARRRIDLPGRESVDNLEMSPDGKRAAWALGRDVYLVDGKAAPARIAHEAGDVTTLWFADDGKALLWASSTRVVVRDASGEHAIAVAAQSARFRRDLSGVLIASEHDVIAWDPATGKREALYHTERTVDAAESFAGGVVTLSSVAGRPVRAR